MSLPPPERDDQAFAEVAAAVNDLHRRGLIEPVEPTVVVRGVAWPIYALDEHLRAVVAYTKAVHELAEAAITGQFINNGDRQRAAAGVALTAVEDTRDLLARYVTTTPPPEEAPDGAPRSD